MILEFWFLKRLTIIINSYISVHALSTFCELLEKRQLKLLYYETCASQYPIIFFFHTL